MGACVGKAEAVTLVQSLQSVATLRLKQQDRRADSPQLPVLFLTCGNLSWFIFSHSMFSAAFVSSF